MCASIVFRAGRKSHGDITVTMEIRLHQKGMEHRLGLALLVSSQIINLWTYLICATAHDVIGCGVDFTLNKAFYTKNGTLLGEHS